MGAQDLAVILHGGAGKYKESSLLKLPYLKEALDAAWRELIEGRQGAYAVEAALRVMEGCEYFNAGYGGYPNDHGIVLLDVGLMSGEREFVSILNLRRVKYPSSVALDLMQKHQCLMTVWTHELMQGLEVAPGEVRDRYGLVEKHEDLVAPYVKQLLQKGEAEVQTHGTVGCVVRDREGKIFSGTSTGGVSLKVNGRIGDSPVIGSGVYADNEIGGISTTGHGESFMRSLFSGHVLSSMRAQLRRDASVFEQQGALSHLLRDEMEELGRKSGGRGGAIIVVPSRGDPTYAFNSEMVSLAWRVGDRGHIRGEEVAIKRLNK